MPGALPRARLVVERSLLAEDGRLLHGVPIGGLPLLTRQLLSLRQAGIEDVTLAADTDTHAVLRQVLNRLPRVDARRVTLIDPAQPIDGTGPGTLVAPMTLLLDWRAIRQLVRTAADSGRPVICVDRLPENYPAAAKSPFTVGAPGRDDGRVLDAAAQKEGAWHPLGVTVVKAAGVVPPAAALTDPVLLSVGRYWWHRVHDAASAAQAETKILLGTIKPTDGIYAKTNRRVSLRISRRLLSTRITPNQVTLATLVCSAFAGAIMAGGTYPSFVLGGLLAWFASMLDGVDGELARARFQATPLGHWLEMACDYGFYIAVVTGYGVGFFRTTGSRTWLVLAAAGAAGVVASFLAVARTKHAYSTREPEGDYYVAFQRTTMAHASNPVHLFTRYTTFLVSRAAFPYFIVLFAVLGLSRVMFLMILVGTHLSWILTLYAGRLGVSLTPKETAATTAADQRVTPMRTMPYVADEP